MSDNGASSIPSETHTIVPQTNTVPIPLIDQRCEVHPEEVISTYCEECDLPCCASCLVENHQQHKMSKIENKYLSAEKRLKDYIEQLDTDVRPTLDKMEARVEEDVKEDNSTKEKVINDIKEFRKDFIQKFDRSCDDLIKDVDEISSQNTEGLSKLEKSKNMIGPLKEIIKEKIEKGKLDIIKYEPPKLESLTPTIKRHNKVVLSFEPPMKILEVIKESFGKLEIEREIMHKFTMSISVHVDKLRSFDNKIGATSLTTAGNNTVWVMDYKKPTMYMFNDEGEKSHKTLKNSKGIKDMAITSSGEMIVTCGDEKVRRLSKSGEVFKFKIDTSPFACEGVCVNDKEEIVVCMRNNDDSNHVAVYSSDGRIKKREIRGRDDQGKHLIIDPYRVVQNGQDLCVVNEAENVVCVDERDNKRWMYVGEQAELEVSFDPRGICVDKYNNMLVTDCENNCVHYIDREGELIRVITQKQTRLLEPEGICVDDVTGHVWIGNANIKNSNDVVIAKYLKSKKDI